MVTWIWESELATYCFLKIRVFESAAEVLNVLTLNGRIKPSGVTRSQGVHCPGRSILGAPN